MKFQRGVPEIEGYYWVARFPDAPPFAVRAVRNPDGTLDAWSYSGMLRGGWQYGDMWWLGPIEEVESFREHEVFLLWEARSYSDPFSPTCDLFNLASNLPNLACGYYWATGDISEKPALVWVCDGDWRVVGTHCWPKSRYFMCFLGPPGSVPISRRMGQDAR